MNQSFSPKSGASFFHGKSLDRLPEIDIPKGFCGISAESDLQCGGTLTPWQSKCGGRYQ
jgi:hypothetical protein